VVVLAAVVLPVPFPTLVFAVYNLFLLFLWLVDVCVSPSARDFSVARHPAEKLSHLAENTVAFTVGNPSPFLMRVDAVDTVPPRHFKVTGRSASGTVGPDTERTFEYGVIPSKRGAFTFPAVHLRVTGRLGLSTQYDVRECPAEYKVYPNLKDMQRYRLVMQQRRKLPPGEKSIRLCGTGAEFESLHPYVEGDDYRRINWNVTARENRLIMNRYQTEKNQPVFLLIDAGRPMTYEVGGYKKLDYAINAALVLADIVNQKDDQSGLMVFDRTVRTVLSPGKGPAHRNALMEALYHIEETRHTSDYAGAIRTLCERQKQRSVVFIFTDFDNIEEGEALTEQLALLKRRHFPILIFMKNEALPALLARTAHEEVREVIRESLRDRAVLFRRLNALSIANTETEAESFSLAAVNRYLQVRAF